MRVRFNLNLYGEVKTAELEFDETRTTIEDLEQKLDSWAKEQVGPFWEPKKWIELLD